MTKEQEALIDAGIDLGDNLLRSASTTAETVEVLNNQMFTLEVMAKYVLASLALNLTIHGEDGEKEMDRFLECMRTNYAVLLVQYKAGEFEYVKPGTSTEH